jgi:hypothetical protein
LSVQALQMALYGVRPSLQSLGEVVGIEERSEVIGKLLLILVVIAPDGRLLEGAVHSLDLAIGCHSACKIFERRLTTEAYVTSRREGKKIGMLFAHLKRILRLDRLRLRGPCGAHDEFLLAATAQNLRKPAKLIPIPTPMSV